MSSKSFSERFNDGIKLTMRKVIANMLLSKPVAQPFSIDYTEKRINVSTLNYVYQFRYNHELSAVDCLMTNRSNNKAYPVILTVTPDDIVSVIPLVFKHSRVIHRTFSKVLNHCQYISDNIKCHLGDYLYLGNVDRFKYKIHLCLNADGKLYIRANGIYSNDRHLSDEIDISSLNTKDFPKDWKTTLDFIGLYKCNDTNTLTETQFEEMLNRASLNDLDEPE